MTDKIPTVEVQYDNDLSEIKFYWEALNKVYYSAIFRLHYLKQDNPYLMPQIMYGINTAIENILSAYTHDNIFLCKHCKQLYIKDLLCLENDRMPCEPIPFNKDMTFEDIYDYTTTKKKG